MLVKAKIDASQISYAERDLMEIYPEGFENVWIVRGYKGYDISEFVKKWGGTVHDESDLYAMHAERETKRVNDALRREEIYAELTVLDTKSVRPLRDGEAERVKQLGAQAAALRAELARLA